VTNKIALLRGLAYCCILFFQDGPCGQHQPTIVAVSLHIVAVSLSSRAPHVAVRLHIVAVSLHIVAFVKVIICEFLILDIVLQ
jgi:hypothetical protein